MNYPYFADKETGFMRLSHLRVRDMNLLPQGYILPKQIRPESFRTQKPIDLRLVLTRLQGQKSECRRRGRSLVSLPPQEADRAPGRVSLLLLLLLCSSCLRAVSREPKPKAPELYRKRSSSRGKSLQRRVVNI